MKTLVLTFLFFLFLGGSVQAQISWPAGQLLPSFPATASTQDLFYLQSNPAEERYLFSSLKGIVNRTQPRIFVYDGDAFAEGPYTWMQSLGLTWIEHADPWEVLTKYRTEVSGLIVYDPAQIHTVNLATMLARDQNAIIASPTLLSRLTAAPYNFPVLVDLRGQFTSKVDVYQTLLDDYWPTLDHRLLIGINPEVHQGSLREYATALGAAVVWLDPDDAEESVLLNSFLSSMAPGACYMGWWPNEGPGIERASVYGMSTVASDFCANLTVHSGMPRTIDIQPIPPKPRLQNKIYVAFILSDGDNLQYVEHLMRKLWNNPDRGAVPIGWTLSPAMVDAMPGALNYYYQSSTPNDNLISGPSGFGYTYPNDWPDQSMLNQFVSKTEEYNALAGFRVITVWNGINGGINQPVGETYARFAPSLLGITAQNTGGPLSIYRDSLPGKPLSCNYCTGEQAMKDHIASASIGWNGAEPRFVIIQAQPWTDVKPSNFKNVMNSLNSNYVVVRPDHLFQLLRESQGLVIDPLDESVETETGDGDGLVGNYFNGTNFETPIGTRVDPSISFNWGDASPMPGVNKDQNSIRWTGYIQPRFTDTYTFHVTSDNGRRLWINDQLIIDKWLNDWDITYTGTIALEAGQKYSIKIEYFEENGGANCKLEWSSASQTREIIPTSQLYSRLTPVAPGNGTGLTGEYFNGVDFNTPVATRVDPLVSFYWGEGSPMNGINNDLYSIRWTGHIQPHFTERYTFHITSDNGRRLWINDQLIIDKWLNDWGVTYTGQIDLEAETQYSIKLEYFENNGGAECHFEWSSPSQARQIVPTSQLFPVEQEEVITNVAGSGQESSLSVYPNPVHNTVYIQGIDQPVMIEVRNAVGHKVVTSYARSVDTEHLHAGVYVVRFFWQGAYRTFKFVKQ
jgi:hypothetical protein